MNDTPSQRQSRAGGSTLSGGLKRPSASIGGADSDLVSKHKLTPRPSRNWRNC